MPRRGSREARNADHKAAQAQAFAGARTDDEQLAAAFAWFRSSVHLLARRRVPRGASQEAHRIAAARLKRDAALYLKTAAEEIDRGDYDARSAALCERSVTGGRRQAAFPPSRRTRNPLRGRARGRGRF